MQETFETGGENLVRGLKNVLKDLDRGNGQLAISMTDFDAFKELMLSAKQGKAVEAMNGSLSVCGAKLGIDTVGPAANLPGLEDEEGGEVRSELDGMGLSISGLSISPSKSK